MPPIPEDLLMMARALYLAQQGRGSVEPNPMVGCVIVRSGQIIGEGWHRAAGMPHAEINALQNLNDLADGATAYVTLEPCCSFQGKRTGSCAEALVKARIRRVVVPCEDPNPNVRGQGLEILRKAGVNVVVGVRDVQARQVNAAFFARMLHNRPYITLKWAQTSDGYVAGPGGKRLRITNAAATAAVHRLRGRCDAIIVGVKTANRDDPLLTARGVPLSRRPFRVILDSHLNTNLNLRLVREARDGESRGVIIYCLKSAWRQRAHVVRKLEDHGVKVVPVDADDGHVSLKRVIADLGSRGACHVMVEGGPTVAGAFIKSKLADRAWVFTSTEPVENPQGAPAAPLLNGWKVAGVRYYDRQVLEELLNPDSDVFYSESPSADLFL